MVEEMQLWTVGDGTERRLLYGVGLSDVDLTQNTAILTLPMPQQPDVLLLDEIPGMTLEIHQKEHGDPSRYDTTDCVGRLSKCNVLKCVIPWLISGDMWTEQSVRMMVTISFDLEWRWREVPDDPWESCN